MKTMFRKICQEKIQFRRNSVEIKWRYLIHSVIILMVQFWLWELYLEELVRMSAEELSTPITVHPFYTLKLPYIFQN